MSRRTSSIVSLNAFVSRYAPPGLSRSLRKILASSFYPAAKDHRQYTISSPYTDVAGQFSLRKLFTNSIRDAEFLVSKFQTTAMLRLAKRFSCKSSRLTSPRPILSMSRLLRHSIPPAPFSLEYNLY